MGITDCDTNRRNNCFVSKIRQLIQETFGRQAKVVRKDAASAEKGLVLDRGFNEKREF
jgi:hypothetical protein